MPKLSKIEQSKRNAIDKFIYENHVSKEFLVQLIELSGNYLGLKTISNYAKENKLSYNGVKKHRTTKELFGVKFVVDNN